MRGRFGKGIVSNYREGFAIMRNISYNAITPFHMLLEAALFPEVAMALIQELPAMEAEEAMDALSQNAVTWRQLLWHWAIEQGQVSLLSGMDPNGSDVTLDAEPFYEAIAEIQSFVGLEFSIPLRPVGEHGPIDRDSWAGKDQPVMALFEGQRTHLVERSDWFSINFTSITDEVGLDDTELAQIERTLPDTNQLPIFGEPSLCLGSGQRVGETWVRITNPSRQALQSDLSITLQTFVILGDGRLDLVRDVLHQQQTPLNEEQANHLNAYLRCRTEINRMLRAQVEGINCQATRNRNQQSAGSRERPVRYDISPQSAPANTGRSTLSSAHPEADLLADMRHQIAERKTVIIVGTGVSSSATEGDPLASWIGLLEHGVQRCKPIRRLPDDWVQLRLSQIRSGRPTELISAAELIAAELGAPDGGEYRRWLRETVGALRVSKPDVLEALATLGVPLATTNYDGLIEEVTGWPPVTWKDRADFERIVRGDERGVLHLHGFWKNPRSVIFGIRSYEDIRRDPHARTMLEALRSMRTLLFVGFGDGLSDPNFGSLLRWSRDHFAESEYRQFRLVRDAEVDSVQAQHPREERIFALSYGSRYEDLATFLRDLKG